ncbi:MAG: YHYH domain-containing protein [Acidobacteria bacterium]|nr:YHYH domain-containing protein [Acidobacteriota bacterium]
MFRVRLLAVSLLVLAQVAAIPTVAGAHGGGLDSFGCHHNRKAGGYHCHRGALAGRSFSSKDEALKAMEQLRSGKPIASDADQGELARAREILGQLTTADLGQANAVCQDQGRFEWGVGKLGRSLGREDRAKLERGWGEMKSTCTSDAGFPSGDQDRRSRAWASGQALIRNVLASSSTAGSVAAGPPSEKAALRKETRTLSAAEAKDHIGETVTVCGKVVSARYAAGSRGSPTFLNLDKSYPEPVFTIIIWGSERASFGQPEGEYYGKAICVTGRVENYQGTPEMVVADPRQIALQEEKKL